MNREQILALEGRALDAAVAFAMSRPVKWLTGVLFYDIPGGLYECDYFHYLLDTAFWSIDAALRARGLYLELCSCPDGYYCTIRDLQGKLSIVGGSCGTLAESPAVALCRAFLLAVAENS